MSSLLTQYLQNSFQQKQQNIQEKDFLITNKITTIINCAQGQIRPISHTFPLRIIEFNWKDSDDQIILDEKDENINRVYNTIYDTVDKGESVLVCSVRGQSRSLTLISAFFMKRYKWTLYKTLEFMNSKRSDFEIRANFLKQLVSFEKRIFGDDLSLCSRTWKDDNNPEPEAEMMKNTFLNSQKQLPFQETEAEKIKNRSISKSNKKINWSIEPIQEVKDEQATKNEIQQSNCIPSQQFPKKSILKVKSDNLPILNEENLSPTIKPQDQSKQIEKDVNSQQLESYKNEFLSNSLLKQDSKSYEQIYKRNMMNLSRESPIHLRKKQIDLSLPNSQVVDMKQKININDTNQTNNSPVLDPNIQDKNNNNNESNLRDSRFAKDLQPIQIQSGGFSNFPIKPNGLSPILSRNPTPQQKQNKQYRKSPIPLPFHSRRFIRANDASSNNSNNDQEGYNRGQNINQLQQQLGDDFQQGIQGKEIQQSLNTTQNIQHSMITSKLQNITPSTLNSNIRNNNTKLPPTTNSNENNENDNNNNKLDNIKINTSFIQFPPPKNNQLNSINPTPHQQPSLNSNNQININNFSNNNNNSNNNININSNNININNNNNVNNINNNININNNMINYNNNNNNNNNINNSNQISMPQNGQVLLNLKEYNNPILHSQNNNPQYRSNNMNATKIANFRKFSVSHNNSPDNKSYTQNNFKNTLVNHINAKQQQQYTTPKNPQELNKKKNLSDNINNNNNFYNNTNNSINNINNNNNISNNHMNNNNNITQNNSAVKSPYSNFLPSLKDKNQKFSLPKRGIYHHLNQEISNTEGNSPANQNNNFFTFHEVTIDSYLNQDFNMNANNSNQESDQLKYKLIKSRNTVATKDSQFSQQNHPRDQRSFSMAEQRRSQTEASQDHHQIQTKKQSLTNNGWNQQKDQQETPIQIQNPIKSISIKTYEKKTPKYFKNVLKKDNVFQPPLIINTSFT